MAFIAGSGIGFLIGIVLAYAWEIRWINAQISKVDQLQSSINMHIAFQEGIIKGQQAQIKFYEERCGKIPDILGEEDLI